MVFSKFKFKFPSVRIWFFLPLLFTVISFYPVSIANRNSRFREEWIHIKEGIDNIADNSLRLHDLYGNEDGYLRSNQTVDIVHLFEMEGLWIAQYNSDLVQVSDPEINNFSLFNPMAYPWMLDAITKAKTSDVPHGEFMVKYSPDSQSIRDVYVYYRWVVHFHEKSGEQCHYLIVVASSLQVLKTIVDPNVILVYAVSLMAIIILFAIAVFVNYSSDMKTISEMGRGKNDDT